MEIVTMYVVSDYHIEIEECNALKLKGVVSKDNKIDVYFITPSARYQYGHPSYNINNSSNFYLNCTTALFNPEKDGVYRSDRNRYYLRLEDAKKDADKIRRDKIAEKEKKLSEIKKELKELKFENK